MNRTDEDIRPVEEELLRPVPVVGIDVEDRHRARDLLEQRNRCDGGGVEVARTAETGSAGVMSRRPAASVGAWRARDDEIDGSQGRVNRGAGRLPCARPDE